VQSSSASAVIHVDGFIDLRGDLDDPARLIFCAAADTPDLFCT
jgi:hypothetical protein